MLKKLIALCLVLLVTLTCTSFALASDEYYPAYSYDGESIVDALDSIGVDSSFSHREAIATENGVTNYLGSAEQNHELLALLKIGQLKVAGDTTDEKYSYSCRNYIECNDGGTCYEVVDSGSPLRKRPYQSSKKITKLNKGTLLKCKEIKPNIKGNSWAKIEYSDENGNTRYGYIFADHIMEHLVHTYVSAIATGYGHMDVCILCGHAEIKYNEGDESKSLSAELLSIADQIVRGDYAEEDTTLWGLIGRIAVGEIPVLGTAADIRDLVYDFTNCASGPAECSALIAIDAAALLPLAGILKTVSRSNDLVKNSDLIVDAIKQYPWSTWSEYAKVVEDNREYAKIGDHIYSYHAVSHMAPSGDRYGESLLEAYHYSQPRGVSPTYVEYILGEGVIDGSTKVSYIAKTGEWSFVNGTVEVVTDFGKRKVITIIVDGK